MTTELADLADVAIDELHTLRSDVAALTLAIATRKVQRAPVRTAAVARLMADGKTATAADKEHMGDPELAAYDIATAELERDLALKAADAEGRQLKAERYIATLKMVGV